MASLKILALTEEGSRRTNSALSLGLFVRMILDRDVSAYCLQPSSPWAAIVLCEPIARKS